MLAGQLAVHCSNVEAELPGELGLELIVFKLDDHVTTQFGVIEEQIDVEIFASYH